MSRADLQLFRRMRGVFWGLLGVGVIGGPLLAVLALTIPAALGMYQQSTIDEIGGPMSLIEGAFGTLSFIGSVAAVVLGATVGSVDHQRGVLRDLVLAGRPRWRIVLGRLVAALAWLTLAVVISASLVVAVSIGLPPTDGPIDGGDVARLGFAYVPGLVATTTFAAGVAMLVGSRGAAIAVAFAFSLIVDNALAVVPKLGELWMQVSMSRAELQVQDWIRDGAGAMGRSGFGADRADGVALLILGAWALALFAAGAVRLTRRDL